MQFATALDTDRKSTRLNSSHGYISYAVFCLKKKKHDHSRCVRGGGPRGRSTVGTARLRACSTRAMLALCSWSRCPVRFFDYLFFFLKGLPHPVLPPPPHPPPFPP